MSFKQEPVRHAQQRIVEQTPNPLTFPPRLHEWGPSPVGHGEAMCRNCLLTNREAAVLGLLNDCKGKDADQ